MDSVTKYIESGILEMYVMGMATENECIEVEKMAALHPEIKQEIEVISKILESYATSIAQEPNSNAKHFLMATIDYCERIKNGEPAGFPSLLNENSNPADYKEWLDRPDMVLPDDFEDIHAKIIGYTPEATTAIVWIKNMAPEELHTDEYEKFLILEGSCDITVGNHVHQLVAGDYLSIPLHVHHNVKITSDIPCKLILQRVAA